MELRNGTYEAPVTVLRPRLLFTLIARKLLTLEASREAETDLESRDGIKNEP
jgi:hypothetical protein